MATSFFNHVDQRSCNKNAHTGGGGGGERGNEAKLTEGAETEGGERGENTDKEERVSK